MKRLEKSELIFTIAAHVIVGVFAILAIYPFIYTVSASISGRIPFERGEIFLWPKEITFGAYKYIFTDKTFWKISQ